MAEKITIDDLAGMVKRGFDEIDKQFCEIHARLNRIIQNLKEMFAVPTK